LLERHGKELDCSGIGTAAQAVTFGIRALYYQTGGQRGSHEYSTLPDVEDKITVLGGTLSFSLAESVVSISLRGSSTSGAMLRRVLVALKTGYPRGLLTTAAQSGK
jgi:hypothetical protein